MRAIPRWELGELGLQEPEERKNQGTPEVGGVGELVLPLCLKGREKLTRAAVRSCPSGRRAKGKVLVKPAGGRRATFRGRESTSRFMWRFR